jgi:hypothetical protein
VLPLEEMLAGILSVLPMLAGILSVLAVGAPPLPVLAPETHIKHNRRLCRHINHRCAHPCMLLLGVACSQSRACTGVRLQQLQSMVLPSHKIQAMCYRSSKGSTHLLLWCCHQCWCLSQCQIRIPTNDALQV